jgi:hypothetical protein
MERERAQRAQHSSKHTTEKHAQKGKGIFFQANAGSVTIDTSLTYVQFKLLCLRLVSLHGGLRALSVSGGDCVFLRAARSFVRSLVV